MTPEYIKEAYKKLKKKLGRQPGQNDFYANTMWFQLDQEDIDEIRATLT